MISKEGLGHDVPRSAPTPAARYVRAAAHGCIIFLALVLARDVLSDDGVPLWPDKGFPLLVVAFALSTAIPALVRTLRLKAPGWGENLTGHLDRAARIRLAVFGLAWLAYASVLPVVGFLVAATAAITVSAVSVGRARLWLAAPVAAFMSVLVFLAFQRVLYVGLPLGPLDRFVIETLPGR